MTFDPMQDIPTTDDEVRIALTRPDELVTASLWGLYQVARIQGQSLLEAYKGALLAHVKVPKFDTLDAFLDEARKLDALVAERAAGAGSNGKEAA